MKASSLPNLNRETPSFPNFFTLYQDPNHHDDTTIHKRPNIDHSEDTEASETSPFKRILSPSASFNEMNYPFHEMNYPVVVESFFRDQMDRSLPRWAPSPNLNRDTTSFPNFFLSYQFPNHHDDTTIHKRPNIDHSEDTEASETSPFKRILSPSASFNEMNENHYPVVGSFYGWDQMDRSLPRWAPSPNGSETNVSVGSNQFSGNVGALSEGPNFTQLRWDRGDLDFPEDEFRRAFKMSKSTFNLICTQLESIVDEKDIMLQLALPFTHAISQRVAVCLWYLATGEPLRLVSKRFGLGISTCYKFLLEVCHAIKNVLMIKYLNWPDKEKMKGVESEFVSLSWFPFVGRSICGSIYTTHVPISAPKVNGHAYVNKRHTERNQKISHTVTVQGVVDSKGIFTDVCIGRPGSMTNDEILETSEISLRANHGLLKNVWIVGNSGYSLRDWVLVPYQDPLEDSRVFNESVEKVQRVAKEAFRRLKGRWRCLQELTEVKLQDLPVVLGACCVLHNICEMSNEAMDPADAIFEIFDDESAAEIRVRSSTASRARGVILLIKTFIGRSYSGPALTFVLP